MGSCAFIRARCSKWLTGLAGEGGSFLCELVDVLMSLGSCTPGNFLPGLHASDACSFAVDSLAGVLTGG